MILAYLSVLKVWLTTAALPLRHWRSALMDGLANLKDCDDADRRSSVAAGSFRGI